MLAAHQLLCVNAALLWKAIRVRQGVCIGQAVGVCILRGRDAACTNILVHARCLVVSWAGQETAGGKAMEFLTSFYMHCVCGWMIRR